MNTIRTLIILLATVNYSCSQRDINKDYADQFVKVVRQEGTTNEFYNFLKIDSTISEDKGNNLNQIIELNVVDLRNNLVNCPNDYQITSHSDIENNLLVQYELEYENLDSVYYVVCKDKILTHIIVRNNKVVSFFSKLKKTKEQKFIPWILG